MNNTQEELREIHESNKFHSIGSDDYISENGRTLKEIEDILSNFFQESLNIKIVVKKEDLYIVQTISDYFSEKTGLTNDSKNMNFLKTVYYCNNLEFSDNKNEIYVSENYPKKRWSHNIVFKWANMDDKFLYAYPYIDYLDYEKRIKPKYQIIK
jgi:hypothetical protein